MTGVTSEKRTQLPIVPVPDPGTEPETSGHGADTSQGQSLLGVEECVRYYPPNLEAVSDPADVFAVDPGSPRDRFIDLFVDVPYCGTICGFCPFNVYPYDETEVRSYLAALKREIRAIKAAYEFGDIKVRTAWIGGGTPGMLPEDALEGLLRLLHDNFDLTAVTEVTVEIKANRKDLNATKFDILRRYGVTRISMGVQSTDVTQLRILGRGHTAEEAYEVARSVKDEGFPLNIDMMYRLPGEQLTQVEVDLDNVRFLGIDHMSWFPYVPHPGTPLARRIGKGRVGRPGDQREYYAMFTAVLERLADSGYEGYTPYHFSLTGRCQYHVDRWKMPQQETLGIGPGAFSFFNGCIYTNEHNPAKYIGAVDRGLPPVMMARRLTDTERITRLAVLGSKFFVIDLDEFHRASGVRMDEYYADELDLLEQAGLVEVRDNRMECTLRGKAFNNDVATVFATDTARRTKHPQSVDLMRI